MDTSGKDNKRKKSAHCVTTFLMSCYICYVLNHTEIEYRCKNQYFNRSTIFMFIVYFIFIDNEMYHFEYKMQQL